jgi:hypothetical protein
MSRSDRHPLAVVGGLVVGDEVRVRVGEAAEFVGEVVSGKETDRDASDERVCADVEWDEKTMASHGWRFADSRGRVSAARNYDGEWVYEVSVPLRDGEETYLADGFEVVSDE